MTVPDATPDAAPAPAPAPDSASTSTSALDRGVLVIGQIARDLVLRVEDWPSAGGSARAVERREMLGGKGANQAVALRQLGAPVILLGVAGTDAAGEAVLAQARADHLDLSVVVRRGVTALLMDIVDGEGTRRLVEHVSEQSLLTVEDVRRAATAADRVDTVCLQLQQPVPVLLAGAELAVHRGLRLVLDGAVEDEARDRLVAAADVVRMDAAETRLMTGLEVTDHASGRRAARHLLEVGAGLVALSVPDGDLVAWPGGEELVPHGTEQVIDPTGAGDAFLAGLVIGLRRGESPERAAHRAGAAATATVQRLGGRPDLRDQRPTDR